MGPSLPYAQWSVLQLIYNCIFAVHLICFAYRAFGDKFSASCTRVVRPHILAVSTWDTLDLKKIAFIKWTWLGNRRRTRRNKVAFTQFTTGNCIFSVRLFLSLSLVQMQHQSQSIWVFSVAVFRWFNWIGSIGYLLPLNVSSAELQTWTKTKTNYSKSLWFRAKWKAAKYLHVQILLQSMQQHDKIRSIIVWQEMTQMLQWLNGLNDSIAHNSADNTIACKSPTNLTLNHF